MKLRNFTSFIIYVGFFCFSTTEVLGNSEQTVLDFSGPKGPIRVGENITLSCKPINVSKCDIYIYKRSNPKASLVRDSNHSTCNPVSTSFIFNSQMTGTYSCQIHVIGLDEYNKLKVKTSEVMDIRLELAEQPSILESHIPKELDYGRMENLYFKVSFLVPANVSLLRNGKVIDKILRDSTGHITIETDTSDDVTMNIAELSEPFMYNVKLIGKHVQEGEEDCEKYSKMEGYYTLIVESLEGIATKDFKIDIEYPPICKTTIKPTLEDKNVNTPLVYLTTFTPELQAANKDAPIWIGVEKTITKQTLGEKKVPPQSISPTKGASDSEGANQSLFYISLAVIPLVALVIGIALLARRKRHKGNADKSHEPAPEFSILNSDKPDILYNENEQLPKNNNKRDDSGHFRDPRSKSSSLNNKGNSVKSQSSSVKSQNNSVKSQSSSVKSKGSSTRSNIDVPVPAPGVIVKKEKQEDGGPDYENIEKIPPSQQPRVILPGNRQKNSQQPTDVDYCDLDLIGESGSKDIKGQPIILGRDSMVDYAEIFHGVHAPRNNGDKRYSSVI